ncbi:DUF3857 domain-containing protein [Dysgonomonas sp. Marseille-P4677]|uniref:DUF3857 domain-containing protein n=1 Tax=Dysgonomonas sp. Marseille-P4677 TaxID=2364790 RepID=UPI00191320EE|nr:DUF3857 domain-containing protein [Dysgonomonas sp. Marseille-P4677]MBK5722148.1 DUF3857 domain-containing protein [Dysgonomonas sp. Marseille-P4677]
MKYIFIILFFTISISSFCQNSRSEIIEYVSLNQIKGDKLVRTDSVTLQINERMGDHDTEILIPYSKGDKVSIGEAWIEDLQGNIIRKLKGKEIKDRSSISDISLYEDDFVKSFELKHNIYPYRIVYSFKIIYSKFINISVLNYIKAKQAVRNGKLIVEAPLNQPIKFKQKNVNEPQIDTLSDIVRYQWNYRYTPSLEEINASLNTSTAPFIYTTPLFFKFGVEGSKESWESFGNWIFRLNKNKDELPLSEQQKINSLTSNANTDQEKAKILYQYLQDYTRYINVSINLGGLQTYPANYVCSNRYGDCKALTNYMQAILKHVGIKSYYTLINAGDNIIDTDIDFPSQIFNHVILTIPFENDTTYLECTSKNTPFGYIGTFTQGRKALLVDENNSHIVNTPCLTPQDVLCTRNLYVDLNTSMMKLVATERGEKYEQTSYLATEVNKNVVDKYIRNNILSGSYDLLDFTFEKENRDSAKISLSVNCKIHNLYKMYGENLIISPFTINMPSYESPEKRTSEVQLDYPEYYKDRIEYTLPDNNVFQKPKDIAIDSDFGKYSLKFEIKDNKLIVNKTILIYSGRYTTTQYPDFYKFIMSIKNNEIKSYFLELL